MSLLLSLFPGIGLLDRAFEEAGFCVVRGPDKIWGGDIRRFKPPEGKFEGIIGGPPCQQFSPANGSGRSGLNALAENLIPEFERCVYEAAPRWFLMENVRQAPEPVVPGYVVQARLLNNRWCGGEQDRVRLFSFGCRSRFVRFDVPGETFECIDRAGCVTANGGRWDPALGMSRSRRTWSELKRGLRLQGLPEDLLDDSPFTVEGAIRAVGNGVPLFMGRAVARAVLEAFR